jgi:putative serine protease PepD
MSNQYGENDWRSASPQDSPSQKLQVPPSRRRGRGCSGRLLGTLLALLVVFGIGLFAGWQYGRSSTVIPGGTSVQPLPPLPADNTQSIREAAIARVRPTVVQINVVTQQGEGLGSGVIIDPRGYIITNNHVIEGGKQIQVVLFNGTTLPAKVVGTAPADDLAVVQVNPGKNKLTAAALGDSSELQVGQEVLAIGNPLGITQTVTNGIVSALDRNVAAGKHGEMLPSTIQTDAAINPGNSGGALVDLQGRLVGVPTLTAIDPQFQTPANGVGFAIPVNRVKFIAPQLIKSGHVTQTGRAVLGVEAIDVDSTLARQYNLPIDHGVLIVQVFPGSAAQKAGLKAGDIIVQLDGRTITTKADLSDLLLGKNPGDKVMVQVQRGNQQLTLNVTLSELPAQG